MINNRPFRPFDIRKVDQDKEKIYKCISCNETSTCIQVNSIFEIKLSHTSNKIYLCDICLSRLKKTLE